jgi:serine/threonine-protein kinase
LDRYELAQRVAQGGMGEVFLAWQHGARGFKRAVIIKRIRPDLVEREGAVELFLHEARLGALLSHPNITRVLDLGEVDGSLYLAMELVEGPDLRTLLRHHAKNKECLPLALSAWVVARAADGVAFAHAATDPESGRPLRLLHRDISPQNLLLSDLGEVKVTDFGIAKSAARTFETQGGFVRGKTAYMSPEQVGHADVGPRADVYALGVVLYEALIGERLYPRLTELQIVEEKLKGSPPPPSTRNEEVDEALDAIVMRALAPTPAERYATATALSEALDRWARGAGTPPDARSLSGWLQEHAPALGVRMRQVKSVVTTVDHDEPTSAHDVPAFAQDGGRTVADEVAEDELVEVSESDVHDARDVWDVPVKARGDEWDVPVKGRADEWEVPVKARGVAPTGTPIDPAQKTIRMQPLVDEPDGEA